MCRMWGVSHWPEKITHWAVRDSWKYFCHLSVGSRVFELRGLHISILPPSLPVAASHTPTRKSRSWHSWLCFNFCIFLPGSNCKHWLMTWHCTKCTLEINVLNFFAQDVTSSCKSQTISICIWVPKLWTVCVKPRPHETSIHMKHHTYIIVNAFWDQNSKDGWDGASVDIIQWIVCATSFRNMFGYIKKLFQAGGITSPTLIYPGISRYYTIFLCYLGWSTQKKKYEWQRSSCLSIY